MAVPVAAIRIDWGNDGAFTGAYDDVTARVLAGSLSWTRGRSADFSAEATGSATFTLLNTDDRFTPDRNWHDNPSFEVDTAGWSITPARGVACTSISRVDPGAKMTGAGDWSGYVICPATIWSGAGYAMPYTFRSGVTYAFTLGIKTISGATGLVFGICSTVTTSDYVESAVTATGPWVRHTVTWTPSADRVGASIYVLVASAAASAFCIDGVQVNPGAAANTYIEAPTKGQLVPGRPVHIYATYSATDYPAFFGYIQRLAPDPRDPRSVTITCYDVLQRMAETDVVVGALSIVDRSARDFRLEALADFERGTRNLLPNPSFETGTLGWTVSNGTITRVTTDAAAAVGGTCCGEFAWTSSTARLSSVASLTPLFVAGLVYRFSVYLRTTAGSQTVTIGIGEDAGVSVFRSQDVAVTTTWQRFTLTYAAPTTRAPSSLQAIRGFLIIASGAVRVDGASFTRGQGLLPYADTGTGRWPNWCGNGSFDGGSRAGWKEAWANLVGNPSFETNTSGWSAAGDAFVAASAIGRVVSDPQYGSCHATINGGTGTYAGAYYAITGTFAAGVTYDVRCHIKDGTGGTVGYKLGIGSQGTPSDKAETTGSTSSGWVLKTVTWTPASNRADVHLYVASNGSGNMKIDGFMATRRDMSSTSAPANYADTGVGGGGTYGTTWAVSSTAKYGSLSLSLATPATALAGMVYDFGHLGPLFVAGQPYTLSAWLNPSSSMPYRVGIGAAVGDGTWDEASTTGTLTANAWTQVALTWTPSADRPTDLVLDVMACIYQTDATARTFLVDGVRVIPGSSADDFEMAHWSLAAEPDRYLTSAYISGTALSCLGEINGLALTRHWIEPTMASPWHSYVTSGRGDVKTSAETFDNDMTDMTSADIDRASIVSVVAVAYGANVEYYSDAVSIAKYGLRPGSQVSGGSFFPDRTVPDSVGPALLARYKDPRARPAITVVNRFPSQLQRELDDLVTINCARLGVSGGKYLVVSLTTSVTAGGRGWTTVYQLEEAP